MTLPTITKNQTLDGVTYTHVSAHSEFPGTTGANEISGTRTAITPAAAVGGSRVVATGVNLTIPAGQTVRWLGLWEGSTFKRAIPSGGYTPRNFMSISASDVFYSEGHGYSDTQAIVFIDGVPPSPLAAGTIYYVRDADSNTFKAAATSGGAAINLIGTTSYACSVCRIAEYAYPTGGTHTVNTLTAIVPD